MAAAIMHPGAIGDLVLALPLAQTLAEQTGPVELFASGDRARLFAGRSAVAVAHSLDRLSLAPLFAPDASIDSATAGLFERFDRIVCYPSQTLLGNLRRVCHGRVEAVDVRPAAIAASGLHASDFLHRQLFESDAPQPAIQPSDSDIRAGRELLAFDPGRPTLLVHPGSGGRGKCWPVECFVEVARRTKAGGWNVAFVIGPAEREWDLHASGACSPAASGCGLIGQGTDGFRVLPELTLEQLLCAIAAADAFLGNDSGPTHLAAAMGQATVAIFGPTDPAVWAPLGRRVTLMAGQPRRGPDWGISPASVAERVLLAI